MTLSPSQEFEARRAVACLAPEIESASTADYIRVLDTLIAAEWLGCPLAPEAPIPRALALFRTRQRADPADPTALDALEAADIALLAVAEQFAAPTLAPALADRLADRGVLPGGRPLAVLLATVDPGRCAALLDRLARAPERAPEAVDATVEAMLVHLDAGNPPPREIGARWARMDGEQPSDVDAVPAWLAAHLRVQARKAPLAALSALGDAIEEVGACSLGAALPAVLVRAARSDPGAAWAFCDRLEWHHDRAHVLEALCRASPLDSRGERAFLHLVDQAQRRAPAFDSSARGWFQSTVPLLALATGAMRADLGVAVIEAGGPPLAVLRLATWEAARVAALRHGTWNPDYWDALAAASHRRGLGPGAAGPAALLSTLTPTVAAAWWRLATLPCRELPWYGAQGTTLA